jgi:hypothetical protein
MAETLQHSEVLEEFEFRGSPAEVFYLAPEDLNQYEKDLRKHAMNLVRSGYDLEDVNFAEVRERLRSIIHRVRKGCGCAYRSWDRDAELGRLHDWMYRVYPSFSFAEHDDRYFEDKLPELIEAANLLAIRQGKRILAIAGRRKLGETEEGRPVIEFVKSSTLKKFEHEGLYSKLAEKRYAEAIDEYPNAVFCTFSRTDEVLGKVENQDWKVVEIDAENEIAKMVSSQFPDYVQEVKKMGYKVAYFDSVPSQ